MSTNQPKKNISPDKTSLDRNPQLLKHWLTRIFAKGIIAGATMDKHSYKMAKWYLFIAPLLCTVFILNFLFDEPSPYLTLFTFVIIYFLGGIGMAAVLASMWGYAHREEIDSTGIRELGLSSAWKIGISRSRHLWQ